MEFAADGAAHEFNRAFDGFEHNVADKSVCDNNIGFAIQNAVAFDIADKVEFAAAQQFKGLFDGIRTFDVFCTDVQKGDARAAFFRVQRVYQLAADDGKLNQLFGRTVDVSSQIQSQGNVFAVGRQEFSDGRTLNAGNGFEDESGGRHQCAGIACRYGGLRVAFFDLVDGDAHG